MGTQGGTPDLGQDPRISQFVENVSQLYGVVAQVVDGEGTLVAGASPASGLGGKRHDRALSVWGRPMGEVRIWADEEAKAEGVARLVAMYAESLLDAEYQLESLAGEVTEKYEEVNLLYDLSEELGALFDETRISERVLSRLESILPVGCAGVLVLEEEGFRPLAMKGGKPSCPMGAEGVAHIPADRGILGEVVRTRKPILTSGPDALPEDVRQSETILPTDSVLAVPLLRSANRPEEEVIGAIVLTERSDGNPFKTGDQKLVSAVASQAATAINNARLVEELKDATRMKRDLELAKEIQASLLPERPPVLEGVKLAGRCVTAENVGGDYFDYFVSDDGSVVILLGDVTGHDLGAALLMSTARATVRSSASDLGPPEKILDRANRLLFRDLSSSSLLVSFFVARYFPAERKLLYANGGHNPPILLRADSSSIETLDAEGLILGVEEDVRFEAGRRDLAPGDVVLFYTDGLTEGRSRSGEPIGEERVEKLLMQSRRRSAQEICDRLYSFAVSHMGGARQKDDITLVVLKVP